MMLYSEKVASVDKGAHAHGAHRHAFRGVIVLDVQPVCLRYRP